MWIFFFDQSALPIALPFLDLPFGIARSGDRVLFLEPDKLVDTIFRCEARNGFLLMLIDATRQIDRAADIDGPIRLAGKQKDIRDCPYPPSPAKAVSILRDRAVDE